MRIVLVRATEVMPDPPVEKMANTLISQGHRVTILAWDRSNTYGERKSVKRLANAEADIIHFGIPAKYSGGIKANFKGLLLFQIRILRWLFQHRKEYDAVHAFDFDTGFASLMCCRLLRKKFIYHVLDYYVEGHILPSRVLNSIIEFFEIRVINAANATIICTEKRIEQIRKASPKKLYVIHNTPDTVQQSDASVSMKGCAGKVKIVYVGVLSRMRLLKETVEAVAKMDDVEMHIGGFGEYEEWMRDAAEKYSNIFFYGKLQYSETLALEKQCDIMMAVYDPSIRNHKYAAPNKFYESIMLGKPIIMAFDTGYDDVITKNDIGILTEYSEEGITNAVNALKARRDEWRDMGERAIKVYGNSYSWSIMKERIGQLYSEL
ncbi:MAG: glycosyltransferase family 4 protein [Bacillota bacterium]|nr:glycosyltransferase family 4 protein [Bacillota bacterium]